MENIIKKKINNVYLIKYVITNFKFYFLSIKSNKNKNIGLHYLWSVIKCNRLKKA